MSKKASIQSRTLACAALTSALLATSAIAAGTDSTPAAAPQSDIALELNKLEPYDKGCRAFIVVNNTTDVTYQSFKLDVVLFQSDGVIGRRFALDLAPLKPKKRTVKLFELDGQGCDKIGSLLINDVMECKADSGAQDDCLQKMTTSSLTSVQISK
ncbi:MAG: hypothetical protein R3D51_01600 [Hyphomicrobiaceae bacterium]